MSVPEKKIRAIAWDLDGTLVYFNIDFIQARKNVIEVFTENGVDPSDLSIQKPIIENVNIGKEKLKELKISEKKEKKILKKVEKSIIKLEAQAAENARIVDGIKEILEFCHQKQLRQVIYTLNTNLIAKYTLKKVKILKYFDFIVGRDDLSNPKPHKDHLIYICNKLNLSNKELLIIGDNSRDIEGANNMGAPSIGILTIRHSEKDLKGANFIIEQNKIAQDLKKAIKTFL